MQMSFFHGNVHFVVRQLEQQVKCILDAIAVDETRKKELIRGDAVDKAEQLSESKLCVLVFRPVSDLEIFYIGNFLFICHLR